MAEPCDEVDEDETEEVGTMWIVTLSVIVAAGHTQA